MRPGIREGAHARREPGTRSGESLDVAEDPVGLRGLEVTAYIVCAPSDLLDNPCRYILAFTPQLVGSGLEGPSRSTCSCSPAWVERWSSCSDLDVGLSAQLMGLGRHLLLGRGDELHALVLYFAAAPLG